MGKRFAQRLKKLRTLKGITQKELASFLGVAQTTIANYERKLRFPDENLLHSIADYFNTSLDYLLGRTNINAQPVDEFVSGVVESVYPVNTLRKLQREFFSFLLQNRAREAGDLILAAAASGAKVQNIYFLVFDRTLKEAGDQWEKGLLNVEQEHYISSSIMRIMSQLYWYISPEKKRNRNFVGFTVSGDLHTIGMRMICDLLELDGWNSYDLGDNLPPNSVIGALNLFHADVLGISATMDQSINSVESIIQNVRRAKSPEQVKIITGGEAFIRDPSAWERIGADGFAENGEEAVSLVNSFFSARYSSETTPLIQQPG